MRRMFVKRARRDELVCVATQCRAAHVHVHGVVVCVLCVFVPSSHRKQPTGPVVLSLVGPPQRDAGVGLVQA